jgi:hypothetical protein
VTTLTRPPKRAIVVGMDVNGWAKGPHQSFRSDTDPGSPSTSPSPDGRPRMYAVTHCRRRHEFSRE